jgi:hypothetical protein
MKEERSPIELLLDENNSENIKLFDDKNNEVEFEQVAIVPIEEKIYAILKPAQKMDGVGDDEALVFTIEEIDDEECLVIEESEEIIDKVFDQYYEMLKDEGIDVPDTDADEE